MGEGANDSLKDGVWDRLSDTEKLSVFLLYVLGKVVMHPREGREYLRVEAGYMLTELGWPDCMEDVVNGTYKWNDRLDIRKWVTNNVNQYN